MLARRRDLARPLAVALLLMPGCDEPVAPRPTPTTEPMDKAALFGDPSLVPTRTGERARQELALARQIATALALLPDVERSHVDVELPPRRTEGLRPRVLVVVRSVAAADVASLTERTERIAHTVVGSPAAVEVMVEPAPATPPPPRPGPPWLLVLGVLGLGYCGGTLVERARRMRRPSPRMRTR